MEAKNEVKFREVQRFGNWVWGVAGFTGVMVIAAMAVVISAEMSSGRKAGGEGMTVLFMGLAAAIVVGVDGLLIMARLITEVRGGGVYVRFIPFHFSFREILLEDVVKVEARRYRPIREYGGWGIRCGRKGRAYNMSGNEGVRIDYANGRHVLIGSQRSEKLAEAIGEVMRRRR